MLKVLNVTVFERICGGTNPLFFRTNEVLNFSILGLDYRDFIACTIKVRKVFFKEFLTRNITEQESFKKIL